jgi:hypothetical protein
VGVPGRPVTLRTPDEALAAGDAKPGGVGSPPSPHVTEARKIALTRIAPTSPKGGGEDEDDREFAFASPRGGKGGAAENATFPGSADAEAIAAGLVRAAAGGIPFCEECQKAPEGGAQQ